ncbi:MAG TPA: sulfotransferase [Woeseiaceae bacterium]|nr:sulfotransferase [Woeseiaceae bacterium]
MRTDAFPASLGSGTTAKDPIILTGAPRTGVRLLAAILNGHPKLASGPDLPFIATLVQQWHRIESDLGTNHERHYGVPVDASRAAFRNAALKFFAPRLRCTGKERFVLQSFAAAVLLEPFAELFPNARFVLMIRDPRDIVRSLLRCDWRDVRDGRPLPYTQDPAAAARFSSDFVNAAMRCSTTLEASGRLMTLPYEELCSEPRLVMARLGAFLNESAAEPFVTPESAMLVTESPDNPHPPLRAGAVDSASVARWRDAHSTLDCWQDDAITRALRSTLGYGRR